MRVNQILTSYSKHITPSITSTFVYVKRIENELASGKSLKELTDDCEARIPIAAARLDALTPFALTSNFGTMSFFATGVYLNLDNIVEYTIIYAFTANSLLGFWWLDTKGKYKELVRKRIALNYLSLQSSPATAQQQ